MRVLVTGAAGYIGSHLVQQLSERHEVHALDKSWSQNWDRISATSKRQILLSTSDDCVDRITALLRDLKPEVIFHLAAYTSVQNSLRAPTRYYHNNLHTTIDLCASALITSPEIKFIFASTGCAPYHRSPYATSKFAAEQVVKQYFGDNGINLRLHNVAGCFGDLKKPESGHLVTTLARNAWSGATTEIYGKDVYKSYVHVQDVVRGMERAMHDRSPRLAENFVGQPPRNPPFTNLQIVDIMRQMTKREVAVTIKPRRKGDKSTSGTGLQTSEFYDPIFSIHDMCFSEYLSQEL